MDTFRKCKDENNLFTINISPSVTIMQQSCAIHLQDLKIILLSNGQMTYLAVRLNAAPSS